MTKQINKIVKTIKATGDNILVVQDFTDADFGDLCNKLDRLQIKVLVMRVSDIDQIALLNEVDMAKFGWLRKETIEKIGPQKPNKPEALLRIRRHRPYDEKYQDEAIDEQQSQE